MSPTLAGLILTLQPLLALLWDILIFGRGLSALELVGACLTVAGIYLGSKRPALVRAKRPDGASGGDDARSGMDR